MPSAAATPALAGRVVRPASNLWRLVDARPLALILLLTLAVIPRLWSLDAAGLSEDEMDKLHGAELYRQGTFAFDGEHPALMKLAVLGSLELSGAWNEVAVRAGHRTISVETAVRLPNALAGAASAVVLFLLVELWFTPAIALLAAWFWAFDPLAMAVNRIAKEDTFVVFFLLLGALLYERGKRVGAGAPAAAQRWFAGSGAAFGLMLASKYLPYLFGIHVLFCRAAAPHPGRNRPDKPVYLGALAAAFLLANFPILLPANWATIIGFVREHAIQHSGYVFQGRLWRNTLTTLSGGLPWWFYSVELLTKMPVAVLVLMSIGLWRAFVLRRTRGAVFIGTFLLLTFVPYSLVATKFLRYMLPTLVVLDIAAALGLAWLVERAWTMSNRRRIPALVLAAACVIAPVMAWSHAKPLIGLYRNILGRTLSPAALWFPPDELYDAGLREAIADLAHRAPQGACVVTEAPDVVGFYAGVYGRRDLSIRRPESGAAHAGDWFVVQEGRVYFENQAEVRRARLGRPAIQVDVNGFRAVEIYRLR
jgi:hypothetical protein